VSRHRAPGRRRAPGRVRRLPDGLSRSRAAALAAKSAAGLGVVGGAAVALSIPLEASAQAATPAPASMALSSSVDLSERAALDRSSRSAVRAAPAAVTAPADVAPVQAEPVGVAGVKAVAKPKPKPKPQPTAEATGASSGTAATSSAPAAPTGSYTGGITAKCASIGLIPTAQQLCSAVQTTFGLSSIGGYRPSADEHGTGQAVDFMISSAAQGDAIAAYVQQHAAQFNVKYVIWSQRYWPAGGSWSLMADRGSVTANHYDHVHVTVNY
jgi:hypothetical protein